MVILGLILLLGPLFTLKRHSIHTDKIVDTCAAEKRKLGPASQRRQVKPRIDDSQGETLTPPTPAQGTSGQPQPGYVCPHITGQQGFR